MLFRMGHSFSRSATGNEARPVAILKMNDLNLGNLDLWKFVDDMITAEPEPNSGISKIQDSVDDLVNKLSASRFQLNVPKCKELLILFAEV